MPVQLACAARIVQCREAASSLPAPHDDVPQRCRSRLGLPCIQKPALYPRNTRSPSHGMSQNFTRPVKPVASVSAGRPTSANAATAAQLTYTWKQDPTTAHQHALAR